VLRVISPAKVNLFLGVGRLRGDGHHDLTTVFHAIDLADELRIETADSLSVSCDEDLGIAAHDNLAHRAAVALGAALGHEPQVAVAIDKRIPHGAGLAGGSSNAAAVIAGLATMWGVNPRDPRCVAVASSLGADTAFFLTGGAALMVGKGDVLERELPALSGSPLALVRPRDPVSTASAYRAYDASPVEAGDSGAVVDALLRGDVVALASALSNNLQQASFNVVPEVEEALAWVSASPGALGALVAGSGSAVFALCDSASARDTIVTRAADRGWWSAATTLAAHGVQVIDEGPW
jgi:4-diphosphocytidyl-2-C-methyl-D-erythritol kinase